MRTRYMSHFDTVTNYDDRRRRSLASQRKGFKYKLNKETYKHLHGARALKSRLPKPTSSLQANSATGLRVRH